MTRDYGRLFAADIVAEQLQGDSDWDSLHGLAPRLDRARHLLAVKWAVKNGRLTDGPVSDDQAPSERGDGSGYARESRGAGY